MGIEFRIHRFVTIEKYPHVKTEMAWRDIPLFSGDVARFQGVTVEAPDALPDQYIKDWIVIEPDPFPIEAIQVKAFLLSNA